MSKLKVIESDNSEWTETIGKCNNFDFYHTQSYHQLDDKNRPVLLSLVNEGTIVALPLIIRSIPNTQLFDCTSAYGYCGPISNLQSKDIPVAHLEHFRRELIEFFKKSNIVSAFTRLHPLIYSEDFFTDFGSIRYLNKTIAIDLSLSPEDQRKQYRKSNKSELNQLRRKGFYVVEAQTEHEIDAFIAIYNETMLRVNASSMYFFNREYFYRFLTSTDFKSKLLLAKFEDTIVAGAIFTITKGIMQYHLAGTASEYIKVTPMKLVIDEARLLGNELNLKYLHLGGGVGGSDDDPLFYFKAGFSGYFCQYKVWQYIVDERKYNDLVTESNADRASDFFPLYRSM